MLECVILGDSIAAGISAARPECVSMVKPGINSRDWWQHNGHRPLIDMMEYHTVVISLGTNDLSLVPSFSYLELVRNKIRADRVLWIVPQPRFNEARTAVLSVADQFRDGIIEIPSKDLAKDQIHPTASGYKSLAAETKR